MFYVLPEQEKPVTVEQGLLALQAMNHIAAYESTNVYITSNNHILKM